VRNLRLNRIASRRCYYAISTVRANVRLRNARRLNTFRERSRNRRTRLCHSTRRARFGHVISRLSFGKFFPRDIGQLCSVGYSGIPRGHDMSTKPRRTDSVRSPIMYDIRGRVRRFDISTFVGAGPQAFFR